MAGVAPGAVLDQCDGILAAGADLVRQFMFDRVDQRKELVPTILLPFFQEEEKKKKRPIACMRACDDGNYSF